MLRVDKVSEIKKLGAADRLAFWNSKRILGAGQILQNHLSSCIPPQLLVLNLSFIIGSID